MKESVQDVFQDYIQSLVDGDKVSLINIQNGAAVEMFDVELQKVIRNCADINTAPGKRTITLKVTVAPNKSRTSIRFLVECKSTIQAMEGIEDEADLAIDARGAGPYAKRRKTALQESIFGEKVQPLKGGKNSD